MRTPSPPIAKADAAKAYADSLVGTETIDGEWDLAQARADAAKAYADALVATETIDGDEAKAKAKADAAKTYADALAAILTLDGDNQPAKDEADAAKKYADGLSAAITIDAKKGQGWDTLKNFFAGGITATVNATPGHAKGGTVGPEGGIAGEAGPEYIRLPDGRIVLLTQAAYRATTDSGHQHQQDPPDVAEAWAGWPAAVRQRHH